MSCAFSSGPSFQRSQLVCSKRSLALLAADCLALFGTMFLIGVIRVLLGGEISLSQHVPLALFLLVVPAVNAFEGLYSGVPPALPEEMRLLGISTSIAYFSIAIFLFLGRGDLPSRTVYVWSWFLSLGRFLWSVAHCVPVSPGRRGGECPQWCLARESLFLA